MRNVIGAMGVAVAMLCGCGSSDADNSTESSGGSVGKGGSSGGAQASGGSSEGAGAGGSTTTGGSGGVGGSGTGGAGGTQASGGSQASGGTAGTGGTDPEPNPTVLDCDGVDPANGWEDITPPGDLGDTQAIALDPFEVGTLYVQMHKGGNGAHYDTDGIYKSTNCGKDWEKLPPGKNARDNTDGEVNIHSGSIVSIIVDKVDQGTMYTASNYGPAGIYKSTNGGVDWDNVIPEDLEQYMDYGGWFNALSVDPTDHLHLVGATHTGCKGAFAPNCLAETRDGGDTWRLIPAPASGNEQCGPYIKDASTLLYVSGQNGAFLSTNNTADNDTPTWDMVTQGANGGDTGLFAYKAANGKYYLGSDYGVVEGSSDFTSWAFEDGPDAVFIVGDGTNLYAAGRGPEFYTSPEASPGEWTQLDAGGTPPTEAGRWLLHESTHKILYSSSWGDGLFRLATP